MLVPQGPYFYIDLFKWPDVPAQTLFYIFFGSHFGEFTAYLPTFHTPLFQLSKILYAHFILLIILLFNIYIMLIAFNLYLVYFLHAQRSIKFWKRGCVTFIYCMHSNNYYFYFRTMFCSAKKREYIYILFFCFLLNLGLRYVKSSALAQGETLKKTI